MTVSHAQILAAVQAIHADQQATTDAAVAEQRRQDDLVIVGLQTSLDAAAQQLLADQDTLAFAERTIAELRTQNDELKARIAELEGQQPPPPSGTQFGALCGVFPGETKPAARARIEGYMGPLAVERIYLGTSMDPALVDVGHSVIATWAWGGDLGDAIGGAYSDRITAFAAAWKGPGRLYLGPPHEPDQDGRPYTPEQYAAAAREVCRAIKAAGNPLVSTTVVRMSWSLTQGDRWKAFTEGVDVDVLGWDAYWRPSLRHTAEDVYGPCRDASAGKPWLIAETSLGAIHNLGSMERDSDVPIPEQEWTTFVRDGIALLKASGCVAATWFETNLVDGDGRLFTHPEALALWKEAVAASR